MMRRVLVVGTSGSGKTTLATLIARKLSLPFHATDPFYWDPGWRPTPRERVEAALNAVLATEDWVMDGNFEEQWQAVWSRADCIIWLDYPLSTVVWQVARRNLTWWWSGPDVWSGGPMGLWRAWLGVRHAICTHGTKRGRYPEYIDQLQGVSVYRFASSRETWAWLGTI
jgi:hypothetical protein